MPHLPAAYNLAHWLARNEHDAEDVVQEACLRAFRYFESYRGGDAQTWLLKIVRNTCYEWLSRNRSTEVFTDPEALTIASADSDPETALLRSLEFARAQEAIESLSLEFREVIILREMDGLAYKDIADIAGVPIGTVMSRLARARKYLQSRLNDRANTEVDREL
jgi:RNA polymerase sigma-70 factor (ECF subfamily)